MVFYNGSGDQSMDKITDPIEAINSIPLFFGLSQDDIDQIAKISDLIEIDPGDQPICEGSRLDYLYILLEGEMKVDVFVPTRGNIETGRLGPLDVLGWSAMTPIVRHRTATSTALTHCWLLRLDSRLLISLCETNHDIGFIIYRRVSNAAAHSFLTTRLNLMNLIAASD